MMSAQNDPFEPLRRAFERSVFETPGETSAEMRTSAATGTGDLPVALAAYVDKIHRYPWRFTDEEVEALRGEWNDDALFEMLAAATTGAGAMRLDAALAAMAQATGQATGQATEKATEKSRGEVRNATVKG